MQFLLLTLFMGFLLLLDDYTRSLYVI